MGDEYGCVIAISWPRQVMRGGSWRPKLAVLLVRLGIWLTHGRLRHVVGGPREAADA